MRTIHTTADTIDPQKRYLRWRETVRDQLVAGEWQRLSDAPFYASLDIATMGGITMNCLTASPHKFCLSKEDTRRLYKENLVGINLVLEGTLVGSQDGRDSVQLTGDLAIIDPRRPFTVVSKTDSRILIVEVPRNLIEGSLGPACLYTAVTAPATQASTSLLVAFMKELVRVSARMSADTAVRTTSIATDLMVASLAERLACTLPHNTQGAVTVQRAKAYADAHLNNPALTATAVADAVGVSPRYLQKLFHEQEQEISDWIWQRRLEMAARRLSTPGQANLLKTIALDCGFTSQAHFNRRFRARFGITPTEFRRTRC
ncbi:helix-turn-helix domain-containing protein [Methylorubrum thiocyanatum]